jgi:hypothetical protein
MVFNATFNNILAISWPSVLLVEETDLHQITDNFYQIMLYRVHFDTSVIRIHNISGEMHCLHR